MRGPNENKNKLSDLPRAEPIHTNHSNAVTRQTSYMQQATGESSVAQAHPHHYDEKIA